MTSVLCRIILLLFLLIPFISPNAAYPLTDVDPPRLALLIDAAENGMVDRVLGLIEEGTDVNQKDAKGRTALMLASLNGHRAIVIALLQSGADPNLIDKKGMNALDYAKKGTHVDDIANILIEFGIQDLSSGALRGFTTAPQEGKSYQEVRVYFATNRKAATDTKSYDTFFTGDPDTILHYGFCNVSIPLDHRVGELESPHFYKMEFSPDPTKHVTILKMLSQNEQDFFTNIKNIISMSGKKDILIFIHGYNVSFAKAAQRTAQIVYDLRFAGVPLLYSWPSNAKLTSYKQDRQNIELSIPYIKSFLKKVINEFDPDNVNIIAHSMGTYGLTQALYELSGEITKTNKSPKFNQIILAAPDIDAKQFKNKIAPAISRSAKMATLYASSNDLALVISKRINGDKRAGDSSPHILLTKGIYSIDVSNVDISFIGHSYYGTNNSVISDIMCVLKNRTPDKRPLIEKVQTPSLKSIFWKFTPLHKTESPESAYCN